MNITFPYFFIAHFSSYMLFGSLLMSVPFQLLATVLSQKALGQEPGDASEGHTGALRSKIQFKKQDFHENKHIAMILSIPPTPPILNIYVNPIIII